jgi:hypothetical protein
MGILDTIIDSNRGSLTQNFEPLLIVGSILDSLKDRDKHILAKRYGLRGNDEQTLEKIGKELQLTRERVRQIEKSLLKQLKEEHGSSASIVQAKELIHALLSDHGGLMAEAGLFVNCDAVGGSKYTLSGTCTASSVKVQVSLVDNNISTYTITNRQTSLDSSSSQTGTTAGFCEIEGIVTVSNQGTLTVQFAQSVSNGTSSVLVGSYLIVKAIT